MNCRAARLAWCLIILSSGCATYRVEKESFRSQVMISDKEAKERKYGPCEIKYLIDSDGDTCNSDSAAFFIGYTASRLGSLSCLNKNGDQVNLRVTASTKIELFYRDKKRIKKKLNQIYLDELKMWFTADFGKTMVLKYSEIDSILVL
jgi:hypothetical protein